jgi:hypothetical protein
MDMERALSEPIGGASYEGELVARKTQKEASLLLIILKLAEDTPNYTIRRLLTLNNQPSGVYVQVELGRSEQSKEATL